MDQVISADRDALLARWLWCPSITLTAQMDLDELSRTLARHIWLYQGFVAQG